MGRDRTTSTMSDTDYSASSDSDKDKVRDRTASSTQVNSLSMRIRDGVWQGSSIQQKSTISSLATSDDKLRFVSQSGVGGVNKIGSTYRATINVASLEFYTQLQPKLEAAIEQHSILLEIRQAIVAAL